MSWEERYNTRMVEIAEELGCIAEPDEDGDVEWDECGAQELALKAWDLVAEWNKRHGEEA